MLRRLVFHIAAFCSLFGSLFGVEGAGKDGLKSQPGSHQLASGASIVARQLIEDDRVYNGIFYALPGQTPALVWKARATLDLPAFSEFATAYETEGRFTALI